MFWSGFCSTFSSTFSSDLASATTATLFFSIFISTGGGEGYFLTWIYETAGFFFLFFPFGYSTFTYSITGSAFTSTFSSITESLFPFFFLSSLTVGDLSPFFPFSYFLAFGSSFTTTGSGFFFLSGLKSGYSFTYSSSLLFSCWNCFFFAWISSYRILFFSSCFFFSASRSFRCLFYPHSRPSTYSASLSFSLEI